MPFTPFKAYSVQTANSNAGTWGAGNAGNDLNTGVMGILDNNLGGFVTVDLSSTSQTLNATQAQNCMVRCTGALNANRTVTNPNIGIYLIENLTTGAFTVTLTNGTTSVVIPQSRSSVIFNDGTNGIRIIGSQPPTAATAGLRSPVNMSLSASVNSNNLVINLLGADYATPSSSDTVLIPFRSTSLNTGQPFWRSVTAALSLTITSTNTLGASNNQPFRYWIVALDNSGIVQLGAINCANLVQGSFPSASYSQTLASLVPNNLQTTVSVSTATNQIYSGSVISGVAMCILGYIEYISGLVTAGTFNVAPDIVQLFGPDMKLPGDIVQSLTVVGTGSNTTSTSFVDVTNFSLTITPTSAANLVRVRANSQGASAALVGVNTSVTQQLLRNGVQCVPQDSGQASSGSGGLGWTGPLVMSVLDAPRTTSPVVYKVQHKTNNSSSTATTSGTNMEIDEIMG